MWRRVLRASLMVFGALSAVSGGLLASLGSVLLHAADVSGAALTGVAARGLLVVGAAACPLGILGAVAAKREHAAMLQLHAALLVLTSLALAALSVLLLLGGAETLRPSLERLVGEHPEEEENGVDRVVGVLQAHRLSLSAACVVSLFLLAVQGTMAVGLRWILLERSPRRHAYSAVAPATEEEALEAAWEAEQREEAEWPAGWRRGAEDDDGSAATEERTITGQGDGEEEWPPEWSREGAEAQATAPYEDTTEEHFSGYPEEEVVVEQLQLVVAPTEEEDGNRVNRGELSRGAEDETIPREPVASARD